MLPFAIIKDFDIFETGRLHFGMCGVTHAMKPLVFEAVKPAFSGGVVPAVALATHRAGHAIFLEFVLESVAGVLTAPDALLNVKLVCHFSECKASRFREAAAGFP